MADKSSSTKVNLFDFYGRGVFYPGVSAVFLWL